MKQYTKKELREFVRLGLAVDLTEAEPEKIPATYTKVGFSRGVYGLVQCSPGWCTGYNDYKGTIVAIKAAIKEMREEVKTIPTWAQYERAV